MRLIGDGRIAKFFMETLLNEPLAIIKMGNTEFSFTPELLGVFVFRRDVIATTKPRQGESKDFLVQLRKINTEYDFMRFNSYTTEQYKKEDEIETASGIKKVALPIITIYLLGFSLPEINSSAVKVSRQYVDMISNQIIEKKSNFIEKLTHDCYIVQLPKIQTKHQTRLDKLLSIFEQANFVDDTKILKQYNYQIEEGDIKNMTDILHYLGIEPAEKKHIEDEQEAQRVWNLAVRDLQRKYLEKEKEIEEKDKALESKDKLIEELMKRLGEK